MMNRLSMMAAVFSLGAIGACGGSDKPSKVGPSDPKGLAHRPATAQMRGIVTSISPPGGGPSLSVAQAGDNGDPMFCWEEDIDGDGSDDDVCAVEDSETGAIALAGAPYTDSCDDGGEFSAALLLIMDADGSGTFALAGHDICGSGADLFGCDFDADGEIGACGACVISGTDIVCEDDDGDTDDDDDGDSDDDDDGDDGDDDGV